MTCPSFFQRFNNLSKWDFYAVNDRTKIDQNISICLVLYALQFLFEKNGY